MKKKLSTKNTRNKSKLYKKRITKKRKLIKKNIRFKGGAEDEDNCPICWDPLSIDNTFTCPNGHKFHNQCIIRTCKDLFWDKHKLCTCPYCGKDIDRNIANAHFNSEGGFDRNNLTLDTFPLFINNYLSLEPEENPDIRLERLLYSFGGLDVLPFEIHDSIMEFQKKYVATRLDDKKPLYVYYFNGFVNKKPTNIDSNNKKYYVYYLDEDAITFLEEI
jgi:hypothetical protein